jgi:hypothetical protein
MFSLIIMLDSYYPPWLVGYMNPALNVDIEIMCHLLMFCSILYSSCWMTEISVCIMLISGHEEELLSCLIHYAGYANFTFVVIEQ